MFFFSFNKFAGFDRVFNYELNLPKLKEGDLIKCGEDFLLCLGKEISFKEQYNFVYKPEGKTEIIQKGFLSIKSINLIHRLVYTYYSTYKSVMKHFLSFEIETLLSKKITKSKPTKIENLQQKFKSELNQFNIDIDLQLGQVLIILPDLRTLHNLFSDKLLEDKLVSFIYSNSSQNQKDKSRRKIKNGNTVLIISTYGEIFQDFYNLQKIILVDPHKRYYSNQQDPRFKTQEVAKQMAEIHKAKLILA
ncbi:MAG: hypothetical protein WC872_01035 [Candidatus Absconditabacterales bacterium]